VDVSSNHADHPIDHPNLDHAVFDPDQNVLQSSADVSLWGLPMAGSILKWGGLVLLSLAVILLAGIGWTLRKQRTDLLGMWWDLRYGIPEEKS
jgi:hypothetical protein